jgi:hypothetical protein
MDMDTTDCGEDIHMDTAIDDEFAFLLCSKCKSINELYLLCYPCWKRVMDWLVKDVI